MFNSTTRCKKLLIKSRIRRKKEPLVKNKKVKRIIFLLLAIFLVGVLIYSLYQSLIIYIPQMQEQSRFSEIKSIAREKKNQANSPSKFMELMRMNGDFTGWLKIKNTEIDYPVVSPPEKDAEYYLHRDFDKNYSFSGTPYIGAGADENSDSFIIYAHNMKNGTMFGDLDDYKDKDWAKEHNTIGFETIREKRKYRVFAAIQTKVGSKDEYKYYNKTGRLTEKEYADFINEIKEISLIDLDCYPKEKTQILMLSTCSYHTENGRFVVLAYRTK